VLRGFMQNHAGTKNMCKKTGETSAGQSSIEGGAFRWIVSSKHSLLFVGKQLPVMT